MIDDDKLSPELRLARTQLDRAASELDDITRAKLRAMRLRAVEAAETRGARWTSWLPMSSAVAAALVAVTVATMVARAPEPVMTAADDADWLMAKESPELFSEQLEFFDWLSDDNGSS